MKVLFLTLANVYDINDHDIYQDLMKSFINHGHEVYVVTGAEKRKHLETSIYKSCGCNILRVQVGNQSECSLIEKGISTVLLQHHYWRAIKKYLQTINFDLVLYATPPITLMPLVKKLKKKNNCVSYLMLKDIFPQNAVDLGMMHKGGLLHRYFARQEKTLYDISDYIGCMSAANVSYLLEHNNVNKDKVEICPNALLPREKLVLTETEKKQLKMEYGIPENTIVFVYGGNLGKPQGIPFLIKCLDATKNDDTIFTLIIGEGSEYKKLQTAIASNKLKNVLLLERLPRNDYFKVSGLADVGMIFLDHRFTIPNFPSRVLPYMENEIPVACVTDIVTDIGDISEKNGFGWKCTTGTVEGYLNMIERIKTSDLINMGRKGRLYLETVYNTENCYSIIAEKIKGD